MKLSFVIPALNEENYIEKTLRNLRTQTIDVEIVVVDNGSSDNTIEIAKRYADLVLSYTRRKGPVYAIDYGIKHATGDIIATAGADCLYPKKWAERVLKYFENKEVVGVYGPLRFSDSNPLIILISIFLYELFMVLARLFGTDNTSGANFAFRKDAYLKINDFVDNWETIGEDIEIGKRIKKYGKIILLPFNFSYVSDRRFRKNGYLKSERTFLKEWFKQRKSKGKNIKISDYWKE